MRSSAGGGIFHADGFLLLTGSRVIENLADGARAAA
jgi:hypothetical protein